MLLFSMENNHLYHADMCTVISYPYHQFMYIFTLWLVFSYQHFTIAVPSRLKFIQKAELSDVQSSTGKYYPKPRL